VKKNVSYGSEDSALWVEASDNVRVLKNELSLSPTGLEVTISSNLKIVKNDVFNNTVGIGLYHPSAAGLPAVPPYTQYGDWQVIGNHVYSNNNPNNAPPGSLSSELPAGVGVLMLGVDRVTLKKNLIENNDSVGIGMIDWCFGVDCTSNPPVVTDTLPDDNTFIANTVINNGSSPKPGYPLPGSDVLMLGGTGNCVKANTIGNTGLFPLPPTCS
jgi:parallel beta-helix repeat protein